MNDAIMPKTMASVVSCFILTRLCLHAVRVCIAYSDKGKDKAEEPKMTRRGVKEYVPE